MSLALHPIQLAGSESEGPTVLWTKFASPVLLALPSRGLNGTEYAIVLLLVGETWTRRCTDVQISHAQIAAAVGGSERTVRRAMEVLVRQQIVLQIEGSTGAPGVLGKRPAVLRINKDPRTWMPQRAGVVLPGTERLPVLSPAEVDALVAAERAKDKRGTSEFRICGAPEGHRPTLRIVPDTTDNGPTGQHCPDGPTKRPEVSERSGQNWPVGEEENPEMARASETPSLESVEKELQAPAAPAGGSGSLEKRGGVKPRHKQTDPGALRIHAAIVQDGLLGSQPTGRLGECHRKLCAQLLDMHDDVDYWIDAVRAMREHLYEYNEAGRTFNAHDVRVKHDKAIAERGANIAKTAEVYAAAESLEARLLAEDEQREYVTANQVRREAEKAAKATRDAELPF